MSDSKVGSSGIHGGGRPRIAVTMGDPAGVGPELCLRLLADPLIEAQCIPIVFGSGEVLQRVAEATELPFPDPSRVVDGSSEGVDLREIHHPTVVDLGPVDVRPGEVNAATGRASYQYIDRAISAAMSAEVDAVTTGPIHKEAFAAAGVPYPGHTELFAARTGACSSCMMLTSELITCSLVTAHCGLHEVPSLLSADRILEVIELTEAAMRVMRGRPPRLTVCGLNPHAGEHGLMGRGEEESIIAPAIQRARQKGIEVTGPLPPDTAFLPARLKQTDAYICMYHDQGLIPLKLLAFDTAVNITLGLPIVRTSVDHGTALDLAWRGIADATSMKAAVRLAAKLGAR